ncbi:MAG: hypothetical protein D6730_24030 [Bacteroidetes bacterium]|nr:MAG: hypothetical protein D6730_24030 [Bacteroidota bacterium]
MGQQAGADCEKSPFIFGKVIFFVQRFFANLLGQQGSNIPGPDATGGLSCLSFLYVPVLVRYLLFCPNVLLVLTGSLFILLNH